MNIVANILCVSPPTAGTISASDNSICPNTPVNFTLIDVCEGGTAQYSVLQNGTNIYVWSVGGGTIQAGQGSNSITVAWGVAGTGVVQITETDNLGCVLTQERCVLIIPKPVGYFYTSPFDDTEPGALPLEICAGQTVYFHGNVNPGAINTLINNYYWDFKDPGSADPTSTDQNPTHTFLNPGS